MSDIEFFEKKLKDKININIIYTEYKKTEANDYTKQYYLLSKLQDIYINEELKKEKIEEQILEEQLVEQRKNIDKDTEAKWERYKSRQKKYYDGPLLSMAVKEHGQPFNYCSIS